MAGTASSANCCKNISGTISNWLGNFFYRLGLYVGHHPVAVIITSLILTLCFSAGLIRFHNEKNPLNLWIPRDSKFIYDTNWIMKTFEEAYRTQNVLVTAPDVLQPHVIQKLLEISNTISNFKAKLDNGTYIDWNDVCFKIPYVPTSIPRSEINPNSNLLSRLVCGIVENFPLGCYGKNFLELFEYNSRRINKLSKDDILDAINQNEIMISPTTGHETNFQQLLGGIRRNESGHIIAASSIMTFWMAYVNFTNVDHDKIGNLAGTEDWATEDLLIWENDFLYSMNALQRNLTNNETQVYYTAGRSYGDISSTTLFKDMDKLFYGGILMFIYMEIVLSKFSWIELRVGLASMGLLSIGMAFISAIGICSLAGISYGPVHTSLPFLLLGLGVDDIFVLMACWRQVESMETFSDHPKSIPERMALMLKHAGSSITVTSVTDVVAFLVGAFTILPSLESFCIYAAVGIFLTYIFAITFVVAVFTLDQQRIENRRNALIPCIIHSETSGNIICDKNLMQRCLEIIYSKVFLTKPGKLIILTATVAMAGISLSNLLHLEQKFDPIWFISERTYMYKYIEKRNIYYPDMGFEGTIFLGKLNYSMEMPKIFIMLDRIENRTNFVHDIMAWPMAFRDFIITYYDKDVRQDAISDDDWRLYLSKFLFSNNGGKYQANFKFEKKLKCGELAPNVTVSTIDFQFKRFNDRSVYLLAMNTMHDIMADMKFDGFATVWAKIYGNWITDEVIDKEVLRNIILALVCVMACTSLLIANFYICCYIFVCVLLTLINVCGFMQLWGLTIDLVSCIGLQLAVGLCVDYAAHIGHTFLTIDGGGRNTKTDRALGTMKHIGAAVLYGGGSTLLALLMLSGSEAYTFKAFFKIFFLVIVFGLYHGVVFLPVVLSLIGPESVIQTDNCSSSNSCKKESATEMSSVLKSLTDDEDFSEVVRDNDVNEKLKNNKMAN